MADEHILIADDEPDVRDLAEHVLRGEGYTVRVAEDGTEALEIARTECFHVLLTDMKMPGMGGLEAFRAIRKIDPDIIGVGMTGYGTMEMAIEALKLDFVEFIVKPFTPTDLVQAVNRALMQERLRRENVRLKALIPLFEISRSFMTNIDLDLLLHKILDTAVTETGATAGVLLQYDPDEGYLTVAASQGPVQSPESYFVALDNISEDPALASAGTVLWHASGGPLPAFCRNLIPSDLKLDSILWHPLQIQEQFNGFLILFNESETSLFSAGDQELIAVLAGQAAAAIENARLFAKMEDAYQELAKVDHQKSEFINIVSHELRTPLALVLGYSNFLDEFLPEGEPKEYLNVVTQNALRLRTIVDDMMNLRYLDRREATLNVDHVALRDVIETAAMAFAPLAEDKRQQLSTAISDDLQEIEADQQKLELILGNLLSNAIKFTPEGGQIRVSASSGEGAEVTIKVQDSGVGLSLPDRERIFDRFYQVEDSLTRRHGGLGLGLSIVRGLVELHGGRIWVESTPGQGSTFCFTIPGHQPAQTAKA